MKNQKPEKKNQTKQKRKQESDKAYKCVLVIFAALFIMLAGYLVYFIAWDSKEIINNPYNTRINLLANKTTRGTIYGCNGEVLAETIIGSDGEEVRYYPYGSLFVHTVGYNTYGKSGVEYDMNYELLTSDISFFEKLVNDFKGEKDAGNSVYTTFDAALQRTAYDALVNYNGAVVALEPSTGKVLAMVSKPDFDPNYIEELWDILVKTDEEADTGTDDGVPDSAMLNRATQGLYAPGSVFKIITTLAYMREHPDTWEEFSYECTGMYTEGNNKVRCYHGTKHGTVDLKGAFALSCNAAFAKLGGSISLETIKSTCEQLSMNQIISAPVVSEVNSFLLAEESPRYEYLYTMIGQGQTMITPLYGAMLAAAVCNDGIAMVPYMVESVVNPDGDTITTYTPNVLSQWMTADEAGVLKDMMSACVEEGTGYKLKGITVECAGKTGTAETSNENPDAWFVGYAMDDSGKDIAVCVVVEQSGTGAEFAVPIAKSIIEEFFN